MKNYVLMTKYFYPIFRGGTKRFFGGIYFDNPRNEEEIKYVANILRRINKEWGVPEYVSRYGEERITIKYIINQFLNKHGYKKELVQYGDTLDEDVYVLLAKMWVIVRCDKILVDADKRKCVYSKDTEEDVNFFNNLVNFERIKKMLMFLSFVTRENYESNHKSIFITDGHGKIIGNPCFGELMYGLYSNEESIDEKADYDHFSKVLESYYKYIDFIGERYTDSKFLFICDTIENIGEVEIKRPQMYLLGIIGLIEMLLTHNPDKSMYNIEDSIFKQYVRKLKYVLYENDNKINLEVLTKELKLSYQIRSDIAHGNFGKKVEKSIDELFEMYGYDKNGTGIDYIDSESMIEFLNINLNKYSQIILNMYLKNPIGLDLLKDL